MLKIKLDRSHAIIILCLLLLTVISMHLRYVARFALDIPIGDEWESLRSSNLLGTFNPKWMFDQHNEHRIVFTKIQTWLLYNWNHWDIRTQVFQNFIIFVGVVCVLLWILKKCNSQSLPVLLLASLFLFSIAKTIR